MTPSKLKAMPWDEVCKICCEFALVGLQTISQLPRSSEQKPLRFIYISGAKAERDPTKKPLVMRKYVLMRVSSSRLIACLNIYPYVYVYQ